MKCPISQWRLGKRRAFGLSTKRFVIVGAAGMVGGYALRCALDHPAVGTVTAIGRKLTGLVHPKMKEVLHQHPPSRWRDSFPALKDPTAPVVVDDHAIGVGSARLPEFPVSASRVPERRT
jgi:hypothetical protein